MRLTGSFTLWRQRQRKNLYFFRQESVRLVSMELFTWRPAVSAIAMTSSSNGICAQLWWQWQWHFNFSVVAVTVWTSQLGFPRKAKYLANFIVIISFPLTLICWFESVKVSVALIFLIDQHLYIIFILKKSIRVFHKHTKLVMFALLPTLYCHIFGTFFFICNNWCQ